MSLAEAAAALRGPTTLVGRVVARRALRSGAVWGVAFGIYVAASAKGYAAAYPDAASRAQLARSLGDNAGLAALLGSAHRIDTVAGFTAWRCLGVLSLVGAVWGVLSGTRLLRGEEESGRWEVLLTGLTTRGRAAVQAVAGLAAGWLALFSITALLSVATLHSVDPPVGAWDALLLAVALTASAAMFLAIGALAGQLAGTRRRAAAIAGAVLGVAFLLRMAADSSSRLQGLRWASPLGWVEEVQPLVSPRPAALLPVLGLAVLATALTVRLARRRDVGASVLPAQDSAAAHTRLLGTPAGLALRLIRPVALGWLIAFAVGGLVFGLVAQSAAQAVAGSSSAADILRRLGAPTLDAQAYLGVTFLVLTTVLAVVAAGQVGATRDEEAEGRLDNLLVRPVSRSAWLVTRVITAAALVVLCGAVAGVLAWIGAITQDTGAVSFARVVEGGFNAVPAGLFVLGLGTFVHAVAPRLTGIVTYALIAWSFLVEMIGSSIDLARPLLETSVLHHVAPVPAVDPDWASAAGLVLLGAGLAGAATWIFRRRDLASA